MKFSKTTNIIIPFFLIVCLFNTNNRADENQNEKILRGVWVSTVSNIDFPSKRGLSAEEMKNEADFMLDIIQSLGLNAVFLQVRPMGDAFYPSKIYPWSAFLSGKQGEAPDQQFDALAYWVEGAHQRGIQIHAWINPYRVTSGKITLDKLAINNPARLHPEWTFEHDGKIYLNPGLPEVRELVVSGIAEIVQNYNVDGIHIDDYFYPARKMTQDEETFRQYGGDFNNIEDWRRNNVDLLIQMIHQTIHQINPNVVWGVSPAGIWANQPDHPLGSQTRGNQTYFNLFADSRSWVKNEWVDYIIPQIYWHIGFKIADFKTLVDWWADVAEGTSTKLYIGMAIYRVNSKSKTPEWQTADEIKRQLDYIRTKKQVRGTVFFTMNDLKPGTPVYEMLIKFPFK
ncbi:MAG: family 10 glycosylhydrolase [Planctomycetia bacterium]|nr:family 10 glycosylhydrolase [Planctomycetia bacterium]